MDRANDYFVSEPLKLEHLLDVARSLGKHRVAGVEIAEPHTSRRLSPRPYRQGEHIRCVSVQTWIIFSDGLSEDLIRN